MTLRRWLTATVVVAALVGVAPASSAADSVTIVLSAPTQSIVAIDAWSRWDLTKTGQFSIRGQSGSWGASA